MNTDNTAKPNCPVCGTDIDPTDSRYACPACEIVYHEECWIDNQGCATYGCPKVGELKPPPMKITPSPVHVAPSYAGPPVPFQNAGPYSPAAMNNSRPVWHWVLGGCGCAVFIPFLLIFLAIVFESVGQSDLPVNVEYRYGAFSGVVLIIQNRSNQDMVLRIQRKNQNATCTLNVPAQQSRECGQVQINGGNFSSGETYTISCSGYRSLTGRVPK